MGDFLGNILLSILAILLPPVAALIKVNESSLNTFQLIFIDLGGMHNSFLDQSIIDITRLVTWLYSCSVAYLGECLNNGKLVTHSMLFFFFLDSLLSYS